MNMREIRWSGWAMAGVLVAMFAASAINVGRPNPDRSMERICMATSQETWLRQRTGETDAWKTPSISGGELRVRKPPLLVWLNMLAWRGLDPETATLEQLALRARLVTIALVLLGVASAGWVGWMFGGPRGGLLTTLIAGSMTLVTKYSHYTTYDPHVMGWTGMCVACAVWAMQPHYPESWRARHFWGWLPAGLALGAAVMTKGPVATVYALLPVAWMIVITRFRRRTHIGGLAVTVLVAALVSFWWYWHLMRLGGGAMATLGQEYSGTDEDQHRPIYEYWVIAVAVFPWTIWWGGGLVKPVMDKHAREDLRMWVAWGWFVTSFVAIAIWPMRIDRYLVPLMPAAAVLAATWLLPLIERNAEPAVWMRRCWKGLFIACWIVSLVLPVFMVVEPPLLERGVMREEFLAPIAWPVLALATAGLVGLAAHGWRMTRRNRLDAMCVTLGLWMVLLNGILNHGHNRAARRVPSFGAEAAALFELTRGMPVYYLADEARRTRQPGLGFRIHSRRIIRPVTKAGLREMTEGGVAFAVLIAADGGTENAAAALEFESKLTVREKGGTWTLYRPRGVEEGSVLINDK